MTNVLVAGHLIGLRLAQSGDESSSTIEIGHHVQRTWHGLTFNIDTIFSTLVAGAVVLIMGFS